MVSIVSGPAESQFRKVAGSDYNTSGLIGDIHKDLRSFSGLSDLIRNVTNLRIVTDIPEMQVHRLPDIHLPKLRSQASAGLTGILICPVCSAEAGHSHSRNILPRHPQHIESPYCHEKSQRRIQAPGKADDNVPAMDMRQSFLKSHSLDIQDLLTTSVSLLFHARNERTGIKSPGKFCLRFFHAEKYLRIISVFISAGYIRSKTAGSHPSPLVDQSPDIQFA